MTLCWLIRLRRAVGLAWLSLLVGVFALAGATHLAPHAGHTLLVIRGASMAPSIPLGSLIAVGAVAPSAVSVGDVVAVRADNGVVVTHRVAEIVAADGEPAFMLRGDANASADPRPVAGSAVVGRLAFHLPVLGYVLFLLSVPSGVVSVMSLLGALLAWYLLLEELEWAAAARRRRGRLGHAPAASSAGTA